MVGAKSPADSRHRRQRSGFRRRAARPNAPHVRVAGAAFLALHAPPRTLGKRPWETVYFSNSSRAVRGPFSNGATGSPARAVALLSAAPGIVSARLFDPAATPATRRKSRINFCRNRANPTLVRASARPDAGGRRRRFRSPFVISRSRAIAATDDCHRRGLVCFYRVCVRIRCRGYPSFVLAIVFICRLYPRRTRDAESCDSAPGGRSNRRGARIANSNREFVFLDREDASSRGGVAL